MHEFRVPIIRDCSELCFENLDEDLGVSGLRDFSANTSGVGSAQADVAGALTLCTGESSQIVAGV
jgi:hypothetical protein